MYKANLKKILLFCAIGLKTSLSLQAQIQMPAIFSDNMVLQREKPIPIWGTATAGEQITVSFQEQNLVTKANEVGKWLITLQPLKASKTAATLTVKASNTLEFKNILVGDVWLCSGQSNMEYPLERKLKKYAAPKNGTDVAAEEVLKEKPDAIRYLYVERTLNKIDLPTKGWTDGNDTIVKYVSAIGYFFAKEIYETVDIPIGIISTSWGGTRVEQWTPDWAYQQSEWFKKDAQTPNFKIDGMHPGQMYDRLIQPLLPFGIKGILWYQGESNCIIEDQATYHQKVELMIETWRKEFKDSQLPFYYVQIAPYKYTARKDAKPHTTASLPLTWEAQTKNLNIPNTAMVVTTDLVDNLSDIHPSYKWIIAHRLALCALAKNYQKKLVYSGPMLSSLSIKKDKAILTFKHIGKGLVSSDDKPLSWFSIAGEDNQFVPANATIKGKKIIVSATAVAKPTQVRFAWNEEAQPNLFNKDGLPAVPFRTNN